MINPPKVYTPQACGQALHRRLNLYEKKYLLPIEGRGVHKILKYFRNQSGLTYLKAVLYDLFSR